jgi:hypothetical protein
MSSPVLSTDPGQVSAYSVRRPSDYPTVGAQPLHLYNSGIHTPKHHQTVFAHNKPNEVQCISSAQGAATSPAKVPLLYLHHGQIGWAVLSGLAAGLPC